MEDYESPYIEPLGSEEGSEPQGVFVVPVTAVVAFIVATAVVAGTVVAVVNAVTLWTTC